MVMVVQILKLIISLGGKCLQRSEIALFNFKCLNIDYIIKTRNYI